MDLKTAPLAALLIGAVLVAGCTSTANAPASPQENVKAFYMDSFYTIENGTAHPQFSVKEIIVNKGDTVRININATKGRHDFTIDEYDLYKETPTGKVTTIEFVADKAGEFVYYCAQPGHRALGHWGTLKVLNSTSA